MKKPLILISIATAILLLFQNCGKGFKAVTGDALIEQSSIAPPDLPPDAILNVPGAPEITAGLIGKTVFHDANNGFKLEITLKKTSGVLYKWKINDQIKTSTEPNYTIRTSGKFDVTVEAFSTNGKASKSRAIFYISNYSIVNGQLQRGATVIPGVDMTTLIPIGVHHAADKDAVYRQLQRIPVAGSLKAEELSAYYFRAGGFLYYAGGPVLGAVAKDFQILIESGLGHDTRKVFCHANELIGADVATFKLPIGKISNFAVDKAAFYSACAKLTTITPNGFAEIRNAHTNKNSSYGFFRNGAKHYYISGATTTVNTAAAVIELPFTNVNEAGLRTEAKGSLLLITDGNHYATVSAGVAKLVQNVDIATLTPVGSHAGATIYRDKNGIHSYSGGVFSPLAGADPATFVYLGGGNSAVFKDATQVWIVRFGAAPQQISGINAASLKYQATSGRGDLFTDVNGIYLAESTLINLQIASPGAIVGLPSTYFVYDQSRLYYLPGNGPAKQVAGVTPANIRTINYSTIAVGTSLVRNDAIIPGVNGALLTQIGNSDYWQDGTTVFHLDIIDLKSLTTRIAQFRFFNQAISNEYVTDGVSVWWSDTAIAGVDIATFTPLTLRTAQDKNNNYSNSRATPR